MNLLNVAKLAVAPLVTAVISCSAMILSPASADIGRTNPVAVDLSLASGQVAQGEPIILNYRITNIITQSVELKMGENKEAWFTIGMTDAAQQSVPLITELPSSLLGGVSSPEPSLTVGGSLQGNIEVNRWVTIAHPGRYTVTVQVQLPYISGLQYSVRSVKPLTASYFTSAYSFPLVVTPADHSHLRSVAEALRANLANRRDIAQNSATIGSVFSMPEADALPTWEQLTSDSSLDIFAREEIVRQLFHFHTVKSFDLLAGIARNPLQGASVQQLASLYMDALYRNGDTSLKHHIDDWYNAQGLKAPQLPLIRID